MTVFESGSERRPQDFETIPLSDARERCAKRFGANTTPPPKAWNSPPAPRPTWDHQAFLAAKQTPVFFGSGVNNFGVMEVLDALVDLAPAPQPRKSTLLVNRQPVEKVVEPDDRPSPAWCSRCRPTWTPTTATASPSCAWPRASTRRA
jgi:peptide chain release factor 3